MGLKSHPGNSNIVSLQTFDFYRDWAGVTTNVLATVSQVNISTHGGLLASSKFDSGGNHDPAFSWYGTSNFFGTFQSNGIVAGVTYDGSSSVCMLRDMRTNFDECANDFTTNASRVLLAGWVMFNDSPSDFSSVPDLDVYAINGGGFGILQHAYSPGFGVKAEGGDGTNSFHGVTSFNVLTNTPYFYNLYCDKTNHIITCYLWNPAASWNQVAVESICDGGTTNGSQFNNLTLTPFNSYTVSGGKTPVMYIGSFFGAIDGNVPTSGTWGATPGLRAPDGFNAYVLGYTNVLLVWTNVSQSTGYNGDLSTNAGSSWVNVFTNFVGTSTIATNLTPGSNYIFRISTIVGSQKSLYVQSSNAIPQTIDMVGWWPLGDNATGQVQDFSTNANNGSWPNGNPTSVVGFNGTTDKASLLDRSGSHYADFGSTNLYAFTARMSASIWVRLQSQPVTPAITFTFISKTPGTSQGGYSFWLDAAAGNGAACVINPFSAGTVTSTGVSFTTNNWYLFSFSYDGGAQTLTVFTNGVTLGQATGTPIAITYGSPVDLILGGNAPFSGNIDAVAQDFRVWNRDISSNEWVAIYNKKPFSQ